MRRLAAAALLVALPAAAAEPDDIRAVTATDESFFQASLARQGEAWHDFAAPDATLPAGSGKEAIGAYYAKVYARPGFALTWHPDGAKVMGDIAVTTGPYEAHAADASGRDQRSTGRYVTVWRRQPDGLWRFVWDGGTEDK